RTRAGNQHVFPEHIKCKCGVNGITEGIENRSHVAIDDGIVSPQVCHRQSDEFCETACPVHPDTRGVGAEMSSSGHAVAAPAAYNVPFTRNQFSRLKVVYV